MNLEQYQQKNKLTDKQLAHNIGITRMTLYKIKKYKSAKTTVETCIRIQNATGLKFTDFIDNIDALKKIKRTS